MASQPLNSTSCRNDGSCKTPSRNSLPPSVLMRVVQYWTRFVHAVALSVTAARGAEGLQQAPTPLPPPFLLGQSALRDGNPLAGYVEMLSLDSAYRSSPIFAKVYPEMRANLEEFLGMSRAGISALSFPAFRIGDALQPTPISPNFVPRPALDVFAERAARTRIVIWGEEHHLPQTRCLYEPLLRRLWDEGYRYFAAETFADTVMSPGFATPDYRSGLYLRDPVFAAAVRTAVSLGYKLVAYEETGRGPAGDNSYRDRRQAEHLKERVFDRDANARVLVIAGRGHASKVTAPDGWTPMASVLRQLTGIDPLTIYAPRMTERSTRGEEDGMYQYATARGLISQPTAFVDTTTGAILGQGQSLDAYVFWPRITIEDGRPDWMRACMDRRAVSVPAGLGSGSELLLAQAFVDGEPMTAIAADQIVFRASESPPVLMVAPGAYAIRVINQAGALMHGRHVNVPARGIVRD
ncbi:MAG: hypothetical protein JWM95_1479 [Gemmatimonadetes bacterium]|nr:hypothetical protein [Gemmatimonadota bacterium]